VKETYLDVVLIQNGRISGVGETVIHGHHWVGKHRGHEKRGVKQHWGSENLWSEKWRARVLPVCTVCGAGRRGSTWELSGGLTIESGPEECASSTWDQLASSQGATLIRAPRAAGPVSCPPFSPTTVRWIQKNLFHYLYKFLSLSPPHAFSPHNSPSQVFPMECVLPVSECVCDF
jgi:hypothetical protein